MDVLFHEEEVELVFGFPSTDVVDDDDEITLAPAPELLLLLEEYVVLLDLLVPLPDPDEPLEEEELLEE